MFVGDSWYVASWADEIAAGPIARRICGQPLVLYRDSAGQPAALYDSCCHRGAPLSVGTVTANGLRCAYHGLVFAVDGRCVEIPGQDRIPQKARVRSYPVTEKDQLIWIWMGDPSKADQSKIIDYPIHDDSVHWPHRHGVYHVDSSYLILADNLMDLTHLGYVHASTVGGAARAHVEAVTDARPTDRGVFVNRWMATCEPPPSYRRSVDLPDEVERWQEFEFIAPSSVLQWNGAVPVGQGAQDPTKREGGFSHRLFHSLTPETETSCFYFWSAAHSHRANDPAATNELVDEISKALEEDKWIVQLQQSRVQETGESWLVDIRSDMPRIALRRSLARMMENSGPVAAGPV
jgi:phenylpropionate dioxygenase-like ring-hydroxylating dioxygenase large terminal subunit